MRILSLPALLAGLLLAVACGDDPVGAGRNEMAISADTTFIAPRETVQLRVVGGGGAPDTITWRSLNERVATVSGSGVVTGHSVGTAEVVARRAGAADTIQIHVTPSPERAITAGSAHACVLDVSGRAYCWGANGEGQLGNGSSASSATPVAVTGNLTFESIEVGGNTSCGITPTGDAYCWGSGAQGQLGTGTNQNSSSPVKVPAPQPLAIISVGGRDVVCALGRDGTAYCWGSNTAGNVGTGDRAAASTPTAVSTAVKFSQIGVGVVHTCAATPEGAAYCWGSSNLLTLGTGDRTERLLPSAIVGGLRFTDFSAGSIVNCGIRSGGGAYCWGSNLLGTLGIGTTFITGTQGVEPTPMLDDPGFVRVDAGQENHIYTPTCLLTAAGRAYCLGGNSAGQLGTDAATETCRVNSTTTTPCATRVVPVSGGHSFVVVKPGAQFVCGLTPDGRALCWGSNSAGQIGTFAGTQTFTPTRVAEQLRLP
jgi:alpha-tubulin suppressor-like RCC1 family protein